MITLAGIELNNSLYLDGIESAQLTASSQTRTLGGESIIIIQPQPGGRALSLTSQSSGATQGLWCKSAIDQLKAVEILAQPVTLDYRGDIYTVFIVSSEFTPFLQNELEGPNKSFTGTVNLIEA